MPDDVEVSDDGWRNALSESFDKVVASEAPIGAPTAPAESVPAADDTRAPETDTRTAGDRARDGSGRFVAKPAPDKPVAAPAGPVAGQGAPGPIPVPAAAPAFKPPQSWKPALREKWASIPPEVQAEVDRREKEIAQALQQSAQAQKGAQTWNEVTRPYEAQIRQLGAQPQQYVGDLLRTAHALTYSAPQQKAAIVAGLCQQFNVSPQDLDSALVAAMQGRPQQQQQQAPQQFRDPRMDQLLRGIEARENAVITQRSEKFAESHEHFEDVADEMVSLLEAWKLQGKDHSSDAAMEKAYGIACNSNESVAQQVLKQKAAQSAANAQASTQRAKAAASSVKSTPGGGNGSASPGGDDWRSHLAAAADKAGW